MKIISIHLKNFMSFKELDFEFVYGKPVVIIGKNGAGKSTILEALMWGLYGKLIRSNDKDTVLREANPKDCKVKIILKDEKNTYKVVRYKDHHKYASELHIYTDGDKEGFRRNKDAQVFLEQRIGMSADTFVQTILFGQGKGKFFTTADESNRKSILEDILGLEKFDKYFKEANYRFRDSAGKIQTCRDNIQSLERRIAEYEKLKVNHENSTLETLKAELSDKSGKQSRLERDVKNIMEQIDREYGDIDVKKQKMSLQELRESWHQARMVFSKLEYEEKDLKKSLDSYGSLLKNPESILEVGCLCPTCKRVIDKLTIKIYKEYLKVQAEELNKKIKAIEKKLELAFSLAADKEQEICHTEVIYNNLVKNKNTLVNLLSEKKSSIKVYKNDISSLREKISEVKESDTSKDIQESIDSSCLELEEGNLSLKKYKRSYDIYKFWTEAFGNQGIKSYLINSAIGTINDRANYYLSILSDGFMEVTIDTLSILKTGDVRERISIMAEVNGVEKKFERCSGGEARKIDLAIMFSLQEIASMNGRKSINLFLADEIFDWLDSDGVDNAIEVLSEIAKQDNSVHVISHQDDFKYKFDHVMEIVNVDNRSTINNGNVCIKS